MKKITALLAFTLAAHGALSEPKTDTMIGTLSTGDYLIEIWPGDKAPLYLLKNRNGKTLTDKLPAEVLAKNYPELKALIENGIADDASLGPEQPKSPGEIP